MGHEQNELINFDGRMQHVCFYNEIKLYELFNKKNGFDYIWTFYLV